MRSTLPTYSLYDLSNPHFGKVTIETNDHKTLKGQFVQFKVVKEGAFEYLYPAEKYCFLPEEKQEAFWTIHNKTNGEFTDFPLSVVQLGLNDMKRISIEPLLVV